MFIKAKIFDEFKLKNILCCSFYVAHYAYGNIFSNWQLNEKTLKLNHKAT